MLTIFGENLLEPGKLVRFKWLDEVVDNDYFHIADEVYGPPTSPNDFALTSFTSKKAMKKADKNGDFEKVEHIDLQLIHCGVRGMIVELYEGVSCIWYNVLLEDKVVWTPDYNLVEI